MNTLPILLLLLFPCCQDTPTSGAEQDEFTQLSGPYLGQAPPGSSPVLFAPGVVSVDGYFEHSGAVFSPDGSEVYWAAKPDGGSLFQIFFMKSLNGRWTVPQVVSFTERHEGNRPTFSPDGSTLYFESIRNPAGGPILRVTRDGDGWSQPSPLPGDINATGSERPYSVAADGSLYFGRGYMEEDQILVSRLVGGQFSEPVPVGNADDSTLTVVHGFVSPEEDYMILEETDHRAHCALSISYREPDGTWSESIPLPLGWARFPVVSPDGEYLFFMGWEGIYWVNTSFVEDLR